MIETDCLEARDGGISGRPRPGYVNVLNVLNVRKDIEEYLVNAIDFDTERASLAPFAY